jgi:diguanylate cyclase (GGDEF)-like protein
MASNPLEISAAASVRRRIAGGFAVLLALLVALAGLTLRLMAPLDAGAERVRADSARAEAATEVALLISVVRVRVVRYSLSETMEDRKLAQDSLAELTQAIGRTAANGALEDNGLTALANSYCSIVESTFAAAGQRHAVVARLQEAGTKVRTLTSAIVLAADAGTDTGLLRSAMGLAQSFQESDAAASRFLASRSPVDSNIAASALAGVPPAIGELTRLAGDNRRIRRFLAALERPLAVFTEALQGVVAADEQLRLARAERAGAREAVFVHAVAERERAAASQRAAVGAMLDKVGSVRWLLLVASLAAVGTGLALAVLIGRALAAQFRRLTAAEAALRKKSALFETTLANIEQGLVLVTAERTLGVVNERARQLLGLPAWLMCEGITFDAVLDFQRRQGEFAALEGEALVVVQKRGLLEHPHTYRRRRPSGTVLEIRSVPLADGGQVRTYTDITQRTLAEERIVHAARHDVLTALPNRALFSECLGEAIARADGAGTGVAVLCLDLDRFKLVNDTLGHAAGDELLRQVAERMQGQVRDTDTLARMGGDEFAVVMPEVRGPEAAIALARRLRRGVREPYALAQGAASVGVSIGIACYPADGATAEELLNHADLALYRAKTAGRDKCCTFNPGLDTHQHDERVLANALPFALQEQQFALVYQPIWDIQAQRIVGAEALVRWHHPLKGLIPPSDFIPLAERTGLIVELGGWVMETACREAVNWASPISVSVNVAPAQLRRPEFVDELREVLAASGLPPSRLKVEITETQLLEETAEMLAMVGALRDLGVRLSLDDFGTGFSSLSALRTFPFSDVKIDRGFTLGIVQDERSRGLVESILQVCRVLNLECVAEGVETQEQLVLLQSLGCTHAQGYLIGRPEPAATIRRTLWRLAADERQEVLNRLPDAAAATGG